MSNFLHRIKEKWKRYLERMARTNHELYGNSRLSCCDLNRRSKQEQHHKN